MVNAPPVRIGLSKVGLDDFVWITILDEEDYKVSLALQIVTKVLPGHRIEIQTPELPEGRSATVFIVLDEEKGLKRPLREVLGNYPGGTLFRSAEEVDAHLRAERDSWDN